MFILLIGYMVMLQAQAKAWPRSAKAAAYEDTRLLLQAAGLALGQTATVRLTLKKSGAVPPAADEAELLEMGRSWSGQLGMEPASSLTGLPGQAVYRQESEAEGCKQTLLLTALQEEASYVIVRIECEQLAAGDAERAVKLQQSVDTALAAVPWEAAWNVIVQGGLKERTESEAVAALERSLGKLAAREVERYRDTGTISRSYRSEALNGYVLSGGEKVHLQAALHVHTQDESWRLTLGTPVITTEY